MSNRLSDEYDEDEALDEVESDSDDDTDLEADLVADDGEDETPASKIKKDEIAEAESLSVTAKENMRRELEAQLEQFLSKGGKIVEVPPDTE